MNDTSNSSKVQKNESVDIGYVYCYILSTKKQREQIDLKKYKTKITKVIKEFFKDKFVAIEFTSYSYTLTLNSEYLIAEKRRVGRLISAGTDLHEYVHKVIYNGKQDVSGQLFKRCTKGKKKTT